MSTERVAWTDLPAGADEPPPLSMVLDADGVVWVRPKIPGQADGWYRVGGGRGPSVVDWEDMTGGCLFIGQRPDVNTQQVAEETLVAALESITPDQWAQMRDGRAAALDAG